MYRCTCLAGRERTGTIARDLTCSVCVCVSVCVRVCALQGKNAGNFEKYQLAEIKRNHCHLNDLRSRLMMRCASRPLVRALWLELRGVPVRSVFTQVSSILARTYSLPVA